MSDDIICGFHCIKKEGMHFSSLARISDTTGVPVMGYDEREKNKESGMREAMQGKARQGKARGHWAFLEWNVV